MHVRNLELFCSVADERSFSKAAAEHDLTQSAVSQAMQQLEDSLQVQLIDRSKRPLVLTAAGQTYVRGLRNILRQLQQLETEVVSIGGKLSGQLKIGTIYSVGLSYLPEASEEFAALHPEVDVKLEFGSVEKVVEMTTDGEVDFGLVSFPRNNKTLQSVMWQQEPMRLVCSSEHRFASQTNLSLDALEGIALIGFDRGLTLRKEIDQYLLKAGVSVDTRMEFDNADSLIRAIQASRGVGIVPEAAVRRETANGSLKVVACRGLRMTRPLGIIFRRRGQLSKAASEYTSLLLGRRVETGKRKSGSGKHAAENSATDARTGTSVVA
ncbi:LysR family transcriptional regulator [Rhodopirellula maiorica SM1]|uniref:LysR family transcriptional regulator n=1 Tax=Rhodopirellula maiorica SM1 TaxID=1265738 RepID=M5RTE9_9BACT|nr:LysR family transcriptional regulator [Rhodopirellula maiorica]EMI22570.1 LysR family transcriptional regulator [Rhodopirellula maiorica SM1]